MLKRAWVVSFAALAAVACAGAAGPEEPASVDRSTDLRAFEEQVLRVDRSFPADARVEAYRRLEALEGRAHSLSGPQFELALAEIIALAGNGHSILWATGWANAYPRLAVRFYIADDGLHVADAQPGFEALIGRRVAAIEDRDLAALRELWSRYASGRAGWRDQFLYYFLESPELLHAAGVAGSGDGVRLTLEDGRSHWVPTTRQWPPLEGVFAILPGARELELRAAGVVAGDPLYLREPASFFRYVDLPERDAVYLQFRGNVDFSGRTDLAAEASAAIDRLRAAGARHVIVDQRFNLGGDLNTTRELMQALPGIVGENGRIFAITSGRTFSAGISSLGYLVQAGGDRVVLVGAPVGDELEFWAEGDPVEIPGIGRYVGLGLERHDYVTGCQEEDCHRSIRRHPIAVTDLEPDFRPVFSYDDFVAGRDPYLEAVFALMNAEGRRDRVP